MTELAGDIGADACVVWPFKDKDGPMGKAPRDAACVRRG